MVKVIQKLQEIFVQNTVEKMLRQIVLLIIDKFEENGSVQAQRSRTYQVKILQLLASITEESRTSIRRVQQLNLKSTTFCGVNWKILMWGICAFNRTVQHATQQRNQSVF